MFNFTKFWSKIFHQPNHNRKRRTWVFLSIVDKNVKTDPEYVEKIKNIDISTIPSRIDCETPTIKLPTNRSEVKFESSSSSGTSNTKVSSNDQAKTPCINIRVSTKKVNINRSALGTRKSNGKKSLRIRRSKIRPPNLTKQNTAQNTYLMEKSRKLKSVERSKKRKVANENGMVKHMHSEENIHFVDESVSFHHFPGFPHRTIFLHFPCSYTTLELNYLTKTRYSKNMRKGSILPRCARNKVLTWDMSET